MPDCSIAASQMANPSEDDAATTAATVAMAAAKRQPIFLPGFDRVTQLEMDFTSPSFGPSWLRKAYTNDHTRSIQSCLAAEENYRHERLLQEVRYGNNITLFFKACYTFRDSDRSGALMHAIAPVFAVTPQVAQSVADLFVDARTIYLRKHPLGGPAQVRTTATHWVDNWVRYIQGRDYRKAGSYTNVFEAVDDFFKQEEQGKKNGDLAHILLTRAEDAPPAGPRALRKRSASPSSLDSAPNAKKRSRFDWTPPRAPPVDSRGTEEPHDSVLSTNDRQHANDQLGSQIRQESRFEVMIRGQGREKKPNSPAQQDHHCPAAVNCEALVQSNAELQARVESLEKERLESIQAQKNRDDAIRTLQARFTALEKASAAADAEKDRDDAIRTPQARYTEARFTALEKAPAAADAHSSVNDKLVREMQEVTERLVTQSEKLQKLEKQLDVSGQAAQSMQATISSLQKDLAAQPSITVASSPMPGTQARVAASETKTRQERDLETHKREFPKMLVRLATLEAKSACFDGLQKTVRGMEAEIAAQKDKTASLIPPSTNGPNQLEMNKRLRAIDGALERQEQRIQGAMNKVVGLENQDLERNSRIATLENRPNMAEDTTRLWSRVDALDEAQAKGLTNLNGTLVTVQKGFKQMQEDIEVLYKKCFELDNLTLTKHNVAEMHTKIESIEENGIKISKRLDDVEVSQDALTTQNHATRIEELSQSIEALKALPLTLAKADEVRVAAFQAELKAFYQKQTAARQQANQCANLSNETLQNLSDRLDKLDGMYEMLQNLSDRMDKLDGIYERHMVECQERLDQVLDGSENKARELKQSEIFLVVDSLCTRVGIMENGFQVMRDVVRGRRG